MLAHRVLTARRGTPLRLTPEDVAFAVGESRAIATRLEAMGVDVVGDLSDIVPDAPSARDTAAEDAYAAPADAALLEESIEAVSGLLVALANRRDRRAYEQMTTDLRDAPVRFVARSYLRRHPRLARGVRRVRRR